MAAGTVQIGVLVADTGEKPRTLQHWTDLGILKAEPTTDKQGRGVYRIYRADPLYGERKYALLASAYAKLGLPLGRIRHLIYGHRLLHDPVELIDKNDPHYADVLRVRAERVEEQKKHPYWRDPFEAAVLGEPEIFEVIAWRPNDSVRPFQIAYLRQDDTDPTMAAKGNNKVLLNLMAQNDSAFMLNLSKVFEPLHRQARAT